jgi:predicted HTH domain antitoxin
MTVSKARLRTTSIRLPSKELEEIDEISRREAIDRGAVTRRLVKLGLKEYKTRNAFEEYRRGRISLWRAATLAGLSYREALEEMKRRGIPFRYTEEDLREDVEWAMRE